MMIFGCQLHYNAVDFIILCIIEMGRSSYIYNNPLWTSNVNSTIQKLCGNLSVWISVKLQKSRLLMKLNDTLLLMSKCFKCLMLLLGFKLFCPKCFDISAWRRYVKTQKRDCCWCDVYTHIYISNLYFMCVFLWRRFGVLAAMTGPCIFVMAWQTRRSPEGHGSQWRPSLIAAKA